MILVLNSGAAGTDSVFVPWALKTSGIVREVGMRA